MFVGSFGVPPIEPWLACFLDHGPVFVGFSPYKIIESIRMIGLYNKRYWPASCIYRRQDLSRPQGRDDELCANRGHDMVLDTHLVREFRKSRICFVQSAVLNFLVK